MRTPQGTQGIELHLAGGHNVLNALCAAAAAVSAGASHEDVRTGLATMRPVPGRLQFKTAPSGAWIVDDSYNANPSSMKAGIEVLANVDARRWLVMGDMGELGEAANDSHGEVGRFARENHIDRLFATGKLSALAVEAFGPGAEWFADAESLARAVNAELTREVCVLVKGSRQRAAGARGRRAGRAALPTGRTEHMLYWLAKQLTPHYSGFNVFSYLTVRAIFAVITGLRLGLLIGPWMIEKLRFGKVGQVVRDDGPKTHFSKAGTPTMGGMLILIAIFVSTLLWADLVEPLRLGGARRHASRSALIGFWDDYLKLAKKNPKGLIARYKYSWQSLFGLAAAVFLFYTAKTPAETTLYLPFFKNFAVPMGAVAVHRCCRIS